MISACDYGNLFSLARPHKLAFFNQYLRGANSELLKDTDPQNEFVDSVKRFEPARFVCPKQQTKAVSSPD
jgi:hypothetical protein